MSEPQYVRDEVWNLWVRTYGLSGARRLAESSGLEPPNKKASTDRCAFTNCGENRHAGHMYCQYHAENSPPNGRAE